MLTNRKIQEIFREWKAECGITHTILFRYKFYSGVGYILTICTDKPGIMIGVHGETVDKYKAIFKSYDGSFVRIEFIETDGIA